MAAGHWLDHVVSLASGRRRVFTGGWGDEALIERLGTALRFEEDPAAIHVRWAPAITKGAVAITDGWFDAPVAELPRPARRAWVRRLAPSRSTDAKRPVYVVLASSGDEGWSLRERLWRPLVAEGGIEVIFLENAMYGARRPEGQVGANIRTFSDHLLMNVSMVVEARALLAWLAREGHDRAGIAGYSMGGSMAALVAAVTPRPIAAAVFAAGASGVPVFNEGLLSRGIDFEALGGARARERIARIFGLADLHRHPVPRRPDAALLVAGRRDGYVFAAEVAALHARWPGSELRWVDTGHAGALLFRGEVLRRAARDAMSRLG
ncbi:MAG: alpha/beta hydrolase family protein [Minicystis sp.]